MSFLTLALPVLAPGAVLAAKRVAVGMEPDPAYKEIEQGAFSLIVPHKDTGEEYAAYGFPCTEEFAANSIYWKQYPSVLQDAVEAAYLAKGIEAPVPSTTTIKKFTDNVLISSADGILAGLEELNLMLKPEVPSDPL